MHAFRIGRQDIGQLPVVANGKLVGMLRRRDVTRWLELAWRPSVATVAGFPRRGGPAGSNASGSHGDERPIPRAGAHHHVA